MPPRRRDRDLHAIAADGVAFSVMVGLGETYVAAFALAIGHGEIVAGLVASAPLLAGALVQLATPRALAWSGSYRRCVVTCALLQAVTFVPFVVGALRGWLSVAWLFLATSAYWAAGMAASAAWNPWVGRLVPASIRAPYFARRARLAHLALLVSVFGGGYVLARFEAVARPLGGFALLFALATVARLTSTAFLASQSDAEPLAPCTQAARAKGHQLRNGRYPAMSLFVYLFGAQLAVHVAAPYFTPYMLDHLQLGYSRFVVLTAAAFGARVVALPLWSRVAQRRGAHFLLVTGGVATMPLPALWILSSDFGYLLVLQFAAGTAWAAFELGNLLLFFEAIDERSRVLVLSRYNLANASAIVIGSALGAWLLSSVPARALAYPLIFCVSTAARLAVLPLLRYTPDLVPLRRELPVRTVAVRPSLGAIDRPLVAAVPPPPDTHERQDA